MYSISINELPFFSKLVKDYLSEKENTPSLYQFPPNIEGLKKALSSKEKSFSNRELLSKTIDLNYLNAENLSNLEIDNIALLKTNGYAIATAHQPNLFLGPLYTLTKAISTISLANKMNRELGEKKIVPIFVIGSEDHDKEELLHTYLFGKKYEWITHQKGSIGSMKVDDSFISLLNEWVESFGNMPYADELRTIYQSSYQLDNTMAKSFGNILKKLLGKHGLIVLDLHQKEIKTAMMSVFERELTENFAQSTIKTHLEFLRNAYSIQAEPREINLFEYKNGERIRIDKIDAETIERLHVHPENFSPNVILRPLMQQTVLPSIANIGGGAEVAYWLQLKPIFDAENIDFPVIILRDLFSPLDAKSYDKWVLNKLSISDFFISIDELKKKIVLMESSLENDFKEIEQSLVSNFNQLESKLVNIDKSLIGTYQGELIKLQKSVEFLFGKAMRAEKKKAEDLINSIEKIKNKVVENNYLLERKENFSSYYLKYGSQWIENMIVKSDPLKAEWKLDVL